MRISATTLESFRLWQDGDWMREEDLIATIKGETVETEPMRRGTAYHAILEHPEPRRMLWGGYAYEGVEFEAPAIEEMLGRIRRGVFEVKTTKTLLVPGAGPVTVVAKADHLTGLHIDEFKTTEQFDAEKYLASYQWRVMALLFEAVSIAYHVAVVTTDQGRYALKSIESFHVFPYAELETDVRALLKEFCHYVTVRGLDGILRERQRWAESRPVILEGVQPR